MSSIRRLLTGWLPWRPCVEAWDRFWFTPADPATLAAIRICAGLLLLYVYGTCAPDVLTYLGPAAWIDGHAIERLRAGDGVGLPFWGGQSLWFLIQHPVALGTLHGVFLAAIVCWTLGLYTRTANAVVWLGHLSFVHRAYLSWSGMDTVLAMLTFYLLFAPTGAAFSLDRRRRVARQGPLPIERSAAVTTVTRLIQIHMGVIYLCAGLSKLQGPRWWDGTAVWHVLLLSEFAPIDLSWLGYLGDDVCHLVSNVGVLLTLGMEIGFVFLIWNPSLRPALLLLAVLLHAGIGFFMGLAAFGAAMLSGCLAFVPPDSTRRFVEKVRGTWSRARVDDAPVPRRRAA